MSRTHVLVASLLCSTLAAQTGWSAPTLETALNSTASDTGPHLSTDGLTLHFASFRAGNWEIFSATRAAIGAAWSTPIQETALGLPTSVDDQPFVADDGQTIWFSSNRAGSVGGFDLMAATHNGTGWNTPTFVTELNSTGSESSPTITGDGLEIYFLTTGWGAPSAPNNAIFRATRTSTALPFGTPTLVTELSNANTHRDVEISADGLTLTYTEFQSPRLQVLMAERTARNLPFQPPVTLTEFSTVGTLQGVFGFTRSRIGNDAILAAGFSTTAGSQELMNTRFTGLTHFGIASGNTVMGLQWRDPSAPGLVYALGAAFGNTGFPIDTRTVPLDPDFLLQATLAQNHAPFSIGWIGVLDAGGEGGGALGNPIPALAGLQIWIGGFTFDATAPSGVRTIGNSFAVQLH